MKPAWLTVLAVLLAGCASDRGQVITECQQLGLTPGTAAFANCLQQMSDRDLASREYYDYPPSGYDDDPGWWGWLDGAVIIDRDRDRHRDRHEDVQRFGERNERLFFRGGEHFAPGGGRFSAGRAFSHGSRG
jgi:hypothetical protein